MVKYPIDRQYGIWRKLKMPFSRPVLFFGRLFTDLRTRSARTWGDVTVERIKVDGVSCLKFTPAEERADAPCMVYFHGGGFCLGAADYHYKNARAYARAMGGPVIFPFYSLAPKHKYPVQEEECFKVCKYAFDAFGKISLGGDSAGGFLALKTCLRCQKNSIKVDFLMVIYPVVDCKMSCPSMKAFPDTPLWNGKSNKRMWDYYYGKDFDQKSFLEEELVKAFPPTYVETAQFDCLRDEGIALYKKLSALGGEVTVNNTKGTMHGFDIKACPGTKAALLSRLLFITDQREKG